MAKYKVSYTQILSGGKERKGVTEITYDNKAAAQKYADQLNRGPAYKNARARKA